jgi:hypothetical protein
MTGTLDEKSSAPGNEQAVPDHLRNAAFEDFILVHVQ